MIVRMQSVADTSQTVIMLICFGKTGYTSVKLAIKRLMACKRPTNMFMNNVDVALQMAGEQAMRAKFEAFFSLFSGSHNLLPSLC